MHGSESQAILFTPTLIFYLTEEPNTSISSHLVYCTLFFARHDLLSAAEWTTALPSPSLVTHLKELGIFRAAQKKTRRSQGGKQERGSSDVVRAGIALSSDSVSPPSALTWVVWMLLLIRSLLCLWVSPSLGRHVPLLRITVPLQHLCLIPTLRRHVSTPLLMCTEWMPLFTLPLLNL